MGKHGGVLITIRNVLIIMLLALILTVAPGGGNFVDALLTALTLTFVAAIGLLLIRFWNDSSFTRDTMTDNQRLVFLGALGALALMIVGLDEMLSSGLGSIAWLAIVIGSGYLIFSTWRTVNSP
jgi:hypothetical protein